MRNSVIFHSSNKTIMPAADLHISWIILVILLDSFLIQKETKLLLDYLMIAKI